MLVIFGPQKSDRIYIEDKILSKIPTSAIVDAMHWNVGNRPCLFLRDKHTVDLFLSQKGWFIGYAYWDSLPNGFEKGTKDLLEISYELWENEGIDFLKRLNGSFNLFLCSRTSGKSLLSTDRFGTYPLWMAELDGGGMAFSPDFNQLTPLVNASIDPVGIWSFIARRRPTSDHTLLEKIKGVRQATFILIDQDGTPIIEEWCPQIFTPETGRHLNEWANDFNGCLLKTTQKHLDGIDTVGILLSGGVDSRLIASYYSEGTHCFTLADFENSELKTAEKIAKKCGHQYHQIIRDPYWYVDALVPASKQCAGLWRWNHAHFWKLRNYTGAWEQISCVIMGNWFDTFFKGVYTPSEFLFDAPRFDDIDKAITFCLNIDRMQCKFIDLIKEVMIPDMFERCYQEYQGTLSDELMTVIPNASCLADAWDISQFGSVYRCGAFPNIYCLRDFKPVRNIIFDNAFYNLFLSVPAGMRHKGAIIRRALWQHSKALGLLTDSNSWLPAVLPTSFHKAALKFRGVIGRTRNNLSVKMKNKQYRNYGAWPQTAPLWANNPKMKQVMDQIIENPNAVLQLHFRMDPLRRVWREHQEGKANHTEMLNVVAGLGLLEL